MKKLGFIGAGNMGGALLDACATKISGEEIIVTDPDAARVTHFSEKYGCAAGSAAHPHSLEM